MQYLPLVFVVVFAALALAMPLIRLSRKHGLWGIVAGKDAVQSAMVTALLGAVVAVLVWTLLLAVLGTSTLGVWAAPKWFPIAGAVVAISGLVLVVVAQIQMGASWRIGISETPTELVTQGVFRWVRHPIYTGVVALLLGLVLMSPSPWTIMGACWLGSLINVQARLEEAAIGPHAGPAFDSWARQTGRFFPGVGKWPNG